MYEARGIGGDNLIDRWDWQEELRQRHIAPIRGTQTSTAPTNAPAPICGRNIDSTVVAGTQNGVPIGPNTVTALNLAQNPNYNAAPTFQTAPHNQANSGAFDYIGSGSGAYDVYTNFVIAAPAGNLGIDPPWLDVLRFYKVPQGASFDPHVNPAAAIMDVNARGDGNYQLVRIPGNVAGQAYDIYMAFVDHSGLPSAAVLIGTTSANPIVVQPGNGAPVPSGFAWSAAASAITYSSGGAGTYDTTFNLSLTINNYGSGSPALSTWLYEVGVLVSIAGKNNFSEITVVPPPGGTVINGITAAGLGAGNAYDVKIRLHSFNSNSYTDSAVLFTTQTQYIGPGGALSGSGPNLVVDSNFIHVTGGNPANSTGSNDPYWTFYWIDGASFFIGAGGYQTATGMANYLGVRPGDSSRKCLAQSLPMPVSANQQYGYSGYIDASTCSGNQPLLEIVSTDGGTVYKSIAQTNGHSGIVQDTYTVPASGGPTQVCLRFNSNAATINSSILVFAIPQFQMGVPGPYQAGPDAPITPAPTSPPPTNSPTGDGGTSSGGGGADPTTQPGHYNHGVHSQQTQAVINATAGGDGSYFANSQLVGRHFKGGNTGDTSAMVDSSSNLLFTRHAAAVTGTLQSTLNGPSYLKSGAVDLSLHTNTTALPQSKHDAAVVQGSVTGNSNLVPDSDCRWFSTTWTQTNIVGSQFNTYTGDQYAGSAVQGLPIAVYATNGTAQGTAVLQSQPIPCFNVTYTASLFISTNTPATVKFGLYDPATSTWAFSTTSNGNGRVSISGAPPAKNLVFRIEMTYTASNTSGWFGGPQLELGSQMTAYKANILDHVNTYLPRPGHHPDLTNTVNAGGGIDFSYSKHTNKILDNIGDGSTYARVKANELASGTVKQLNDGTNIRTAAALAESLDASGYLDVSKTQSGKLLPLANHDSTIQNRNALHVSCAGQMPYVDANNVLHFPDTIIFFRYDQSYCRITGGSTVTIPQGFGSIFIAWNSGSSSPPIAISYTASGAAGVGYTATAESSQYELVGGYTGDSTPVSFSPVFDNSNTAAATHDVIGDNRDGSGNFHAGKARSGTALPRANHDASFLNAIDASSRVIGNIYDGTLTRTPSDVTGTVLSGGGIDFSSARHTNKNLDNIGDGTSFGRVKTNELTNNTVSRLNDGTHIRTAANLASVVDTSGNGLATHFAGQTKLVTSGTYAGWEEFATNYVYDSQAYAISSAVGNDWLWSEWYVVNTAAVNSAVTGCGPVFKDSSGNTLSVDFYGSASGGWYYNSTVNSGLVSNPFWNTTATARPHTVRAGITAAAGGQTRLVCYVDNVKQLDVIANVPFITNGPIYPGFTGDNPGTQIYVKSYRVFSGQVAHEQHSPAVQSALAPTAFSDGSYFNSNIIGRRHFGLNAGVGSGVSEGVNLLYNPTFATNDLTGWGIYNPGGGGSWGTDLFQGGRVIGRGSNTNPNLLQQQIMLNQGGYNNQDMVLSGYVENGGGTTGVYVDVIGDGSFGGASWTAPTNSTRTYFEIPFRTTSTQTYLYVRLHAEAASSTAVFYRLQLEYGKSAGQYNDGVALGTHNRIYDGSANLRKTTSMNTNAPNVTPFRHNTHIWVSFPVGSTSLTYYIDDGGGAGTAPTFWRPDGTSFTSAGIGVWNSKTGGVTATGLTANANAYICAYYVPGDTTGVNGTGWHVTVQATPFGINSTPIAQAYADGGYLAVQASTGSSSTISSGTSGAVSTGGGGGGGRMTN